VIQYLRGRVDDPLTRTDALEAVALVASAVLTIAVAAWIEATLTIDVARALLGEAALPQ
jgi:uncharacterized membrane protein SpoIIM required for sporulation